MEESSKRNPDDKEANQEGMPTVFSKLYNRVNSTEENYNSLKKDVFKYRRWRRSEIRETRKEINKHITFEEYSNGDFKEIVVSCLTNQ